VGLLIGLRHRNLIMIDMPSRWASVLGEMRAADSWREQALWFGFTALVQLFRPAVEAAPSDSLCCTAFALTIFSRGKQLFLVRRV